MTMTNDQRQQLIQRYYDGETLGNERALAERILAEDPEAQALFDSLRTISGAFRVQVEEAVAGEDFSGFWSDVSARLPKGPLTLETGQEGQRRAERLAGELRSAAEPLQVAGGMGAWLRRLLSPPALVAVGAALCVAALLGPLGTTTPGGGSVPVAGLDQTIEVESIDSPGAFVMVVQESAEVPAIVWVTETNG